VFLVNGEGRGSVTRERAAGPMCSISTIILQEFKEGKQV
jgi:hypothetical protein